MINTRYLKYLAVVAFLAIVSSAVFAASGDTATGAASSGSIDVAMKRFADASLKINEKLVTLAFRTAVAALTLQWVLTYFKEIFTGDISSHLSKAVFLLTWFFASLWAIGHLDILSNAYTGYLKLAGGLSGLDEKTFTPGGVFDSGVGLIKAINKALLASMGNNWLAFGDNFLAALTSVIIDIVLIITFFVISLSLFVTNLEFWMMFSVAPLALALIPLSAFRDQGMAPLKGALSLGLRVLILGVIVSVAKQMTDTAVTSLSSFALPEGESAFSSLAGLLAGLFGCALMAIQAGKIASAIASGSASFSGSDAIKGGMAMAGGAALAGAAAATVGRGALDGIKAAANPAGRATGHLMNALSSAQQFMGGGNSTVTPAGGGGDSRAAEAWKSFGSPAVEPRPSAEDVGTSAATSTSHADTPATTSSATSSASAAQSTTSGAGATSSPASGNANATEQPAAGNASTASIGGAGPTMQPYRPSAMQQIGSATRNSLDPLMQDGHAVSVQMHVGKD